MRNATKTNVLNELQIFYLFHTSESGSSLFSHNMYLMLDGKAEGLLQSNIFLISFVF